MLHTHPVTSLGLSPYAPVFFFFFFPFPSLSFFLRPLVRRVDLVLPTDLIFPPKSHTQITVTATEEKTKLVLSYISTSPYDDPLIHYLSPLAACSFIDPLLCSQRKGKTGVPTTVRPICACRFPTDELPCNSVFTDDRRCACVAFLIEFSVKEQTRIYAARTISHVDR